MLNIVPSPQQQLLAVHVAPNGLVLAKIWALEL